LKNKQFANKTSLKTSNLQAFEIPHVRKKTSAISRENRKVGNTAGNLVQDRHEPGSSVTIRTV